MPLYLQFGNVDCETAPLFDLQEARMDRIIEIIEKKTLEISRKDLEDRINTFYHLAANLKQGREDIAYLLEEGLDTLCLKVDEVIKIFEEKEISRIRKCLHDVFEENADTNPMVLRDKLQKVIEKEIARGLDMFKKDTHKVISNNTQEAINRFLRCFNDNICEFKTAVEILFEIPMGQFEYFVKPTRETSFSYMAHEYSVAPDGEFKFVLRAYLPKSISMKLVLYEMIDRMVSDVNRNCNRIRHDLRAWIHTTIVHYSQQMKTVENLLVAQIEQAMQKGKERRRANGTSIEVDLAISADRAKSLKKHKESQMSVECH